MSGPILNAWLPLARCRAGNFALITALTAPLLFGAACGVIDAYVFFAQRQGMQNAADAAVLAATREAILQGWRKEVAEAATDSYVAANLRTISSQSAVYRSVVEVDEAKRTVSVTLEQDHHGYFAFGYFTGSPQIRVKAAAQASGESNICVIALDEKAKSALSLKTSATLTAPNCAIYSNSVSPNGLRAEGASTLVANLACTAGGYVGAASNYNKLPITDCPFVEDPLMDRPPPVDDVPAGCKKPKKGKPKETVEILPGIYCGGLTLDKDDFLELQPGIYVIQDGPLKVDHQAMLTGKGVSFYFTGRGARFEFLKEAVVDLEAPSQGEAMAGILMYQDRNAPEADFKITSDYAHNLLGTIYLPNGNLTIDADNRVADRSAYTAIVVKSLHLDSAPNLVLNTDYGATTVPVPDGVGPTSGAIRLVR